MPFSMAARRFTLELPKGQKSKLPLGKCCVFNDRVRSHSVEKGHFFLKKKGIKEGIKYRIKVARGRVDHRDVYERAKALMSDYLRRRLSDFNLATQIARKTPETITTC